MQIDLGYASAIIGIGLFVATWAKYVLKWSTFEIMKWISTELRELLQLQPTPGAINALGLVAAIILSVGALLAPKFERILSLGIGEPASSSTLVYTLAAALTIFLGTLLCVQMIRPRS